MENTSKDGDKGKMPTKVSAYARRKKAAENPPKKRAQKRPAQAEADETAHPVPEHHEVEPDEAHQADVTEEGQSGDDCDDIVRDMEEEEMEREGDGGQAKVRRSAWVNPYEGKFEPQLFPGGPFDKTVLYDYGAPHIAR
ncbi:hypothetical protein A2U01_0054483, partial [Trifolium medium]|nr:hypothetical protein [Trifolium medium]